MIFKKTGETKGHGSIRKNKVYGAIGVLIFGIISIQITTTITMVTTTITMVTMVGTTTTT